MTLYRMVLEIFGSFIMKGTGFGSVQRRQGGTGSEGVNSFSIRSVLLTSATSQPNWDSWSLSESGEG